MRIILRGLVLLLYAFRCIPHLILLYTHNNRKVIQADTQRWFYLLGMNYNTFIGFIHLLAFNIPFRNLFYYRLGSQISFLKILCPPLSTLIISSNSIGAGLFLPHGFCTAIGAKSIGENCSINHNVTIGTAGRENRPKILDNVIINSGAVIFGDITIGNNVVIGANSTVNTNVPDDSTVFPPLSRVIKWSKEDNQKGVEEIDND